MFRASVRGRIRARRRVYAPLATLIAWIVLIAGCNRQPEAPEPDPKAAAQTYLAALKEGDYQTCYRMLAKGDLDHLSMDKFLRDIPMAPDVERRWFEPIEHVTEYRIGVPFKRGAEIVVPVNVTTPNLVIWERMLGTPGEDRQTLQAKAEKQLASGDYPRLIYADQIILVKEANEWRVVAAFVERALIDDLHEQALSAYHAFDFDRTLSLYRRIQEIPEKTPFTGSGGLSRGFAREVEVIEAARVGAPAARSYLSKLVLKNVVSKPAQSGEPGLFGQITNSGDRALDQVELTVSYGSASGKMVYSEKHVTVATPLEFTDFDMSIVPFGPGQTRDFGFVLKAAPEIQVSNKPSVTVTGIILSETPVFPPKFVAANNRNDRGADHNSAGSKRGTPPEASPMPKSK